MNDIFNISKIESHQVGIKISDTNIDDQTVEMLGGNIWVENNLGKKGIESGANFLLTIPVCPPVKIKDNQPAILKTFNIYQHA